MVITVGVPDKWRKGVSWELKIKKQKEAVDLIANDK
jgi:hypothetical protein